MFCSTEIVQIDSADNYTLNIKSKFSPNLGVYLQIQAQGDGHLLCVLYTVVNIKHTYKVMQEPFISSLIPGHIRTSHFTINT